MVVSLALLALAASVVVSANRLASAVQLHGETLVGGWAVTTAPTKFVALDEALAELKSDDPTRFDTTDLILESETG